MGSRTRADMLEETRAKLLASARHYFGEYGYAETSMDDLTAAAGLTRGALYHHFGGKSGLLAAVVADVDAELDEQLNEISARERDAVTALELRARADLELTLRPDVQRILFQDAPAVLGRTVDAANTQCVESIAALIVRGQDAGVIAAEMPARGLAVLLNGALVDASRWVAAAPESERDRRRADMLTAISMLIGSLRR
ncbi:TetR/AcrR family transcriptional regulator [Nocardia mexicana]|uniref:TetR family transcriptional regulator n=1 Tax=Nocardia mexicana TaxID=279262 RepID=A0A370GM90_9NOCA|nr:TetR/AcrR family transcriptional regulator [Nocardia mexicana]RDI44858.1 TetR family transcriptional regulator [Nocardia mexicana]